VGALRQPSFVRKKGWRLKKALFLAFEGSLGSAVGGQQACTRELQQVIRQAGYDLTEVALPNRLSFLNRVRNRLKPLVYPICWPSDAAGSVAEAAKRHQAETIFFNLIDFLPLAREVKPRIGQGVRLVMLSHGLASADVREINRIAREMPEIIRRCPLYPLEAVLKKEREYLRDFDQVVSLAEFEADLCRESGAKRSDWIPRMIPDNPLNWKPAEGRLGFVGTLDHPPSMEGMVKVLEAWPKEAKMAVQVRVVSRSRWHGEWLAKKFPQVKYMGPMEGGELEKEAASWCAFLHPIFCYARGCSTKLATGLGWRIPCLTTTSGIRGYSIPTQAVILANQPRFYAEECISLSEIKTANRARRHLIAALHDYAFSPSDPSEIFWNQTHL